MSADYTKFVLSMGELLGQLRGEMFDALVTLLKTGQLHPDYIRLLRDRLTEALRAAGYDDQGEHE